MNKKIEFPLRNAVKLIPLKGDTKVEIVTDGDVIIKDPSPSPVPRPRDIILAQTMYGRLTSTPGGLKRSIKVTFKADEASRENFLIEVHALFDAIWLDEYQNHLME